MTDSARTQRDRRPARRPDQDAQAADPRGPLRVRGADLRHHPAGHVRHRRASGRRPAATRSTPKAVAERIRPVGMVEVKDASDLASLKTGEQVFAAQCTACHTAGALGAPKFGDAEAWAPRIKTGFDALLHSALAGKGQMPRAGRRRLQRLRDRPRRRLHGQQGRRQVPRAAAPAPRRRARRRPLRRRRADAPTERRRPPTAAPAARGADRGHGNAAGARSPRPRRRPPTADRRRRRAGALRADLQRLPRHRRRRRAQGRRQGRLGAAHRPRASTR